MVTAVVTGIRMPSKSCAPVWGLDTRRVGRDAGPVRAEAASTAHVQHARSRDAAANGSRPGPPRRRPATTLEKQLAAWKAHLIGNLGGDVSTQQAGIIDLAVKTPVRSYTARSGPRRS